MSLTGALNNAVSGLLATQRQIEVTSGNISNAQTEGFTEKNASTTTQVLDGRAAGTQLGKITRDVNPFLEKELRQEQTNLQNVKTKSDIFKRVQDLFGTLDSNSGLPNQISNLKSKLEQMGTQPANTASPVQAMRQAQSVANEFNKLSESIQELRSQADTQIAESVKTINDTLGQLKTLNQDIVSNKASGDPTANLKDKRDEALKTLSKQMDVQTFIRDDGSAAVFTNNGNPLLNVNESNLSFQKVGTLRPGVDGNPVKGPTGKTLTSDAGGRLGALLELRNSDLPKAQQDIDRLAAKFTEEVNAAHNKGTFGNAPQKTITGTTQFDADDRIAAGGKFTIAQVGTDGNVDHTATVDLTSSNPKSVSDVATAINNAISSSNVSANINSEGKLEINDTNDDSIGVTINTQSAEIALANGENAKSGNVTTAASGTDTRSLLHRATTDVTPPSSSPTGLTGGDITFTDSQGNTETITVNASATLNDIQSALQSHGRVGGVTSHNGDAVRASINNNRLEIRSATGNPVEITKDTANLQNAVGLEASTTERNASHFFGINNLFETPNVQGGKQHDPALVTDGDNATSAASALQVREDIVNNPNLISRGTASTTKGQTAVAEGDGSVARTLAKTFDTDFSFKGGGNIASRDTTIGGFAGSIVQFQASETSRLEEDTKFKQETVDNLSFRTEAKAGVNIDEELAQLQQIQQAFNANARLLSTTQDMFQTLSRAVA